MESINPSQSTLQLVRGNPQACLSQWHGSSGILLVQFELDQYWLDAPEPLPLTAIYHLCRGRLEVAVTDQRVPAATAYSQDLFEQWVSSLDLAVFCPDAPLLLQPCHIPKPWGQEIWYTGVEERGVCCFDDAGRSTPIPWLQAVLPDGAAGVAGKPLVLLKILDPVAEAVTGDLYFELHEEKREVYVVTSIDRAAWPEGVGYIRYGFDPEKLRAAGTEQDFRRDYLAAVQAYESVRREWDALPQPPEAGDPLVARERKLRDQMDGYTHMRELRVGDVVVVPLLMPHSLQHGVRTVEFQTPVYERQILSFAQKVLTQDHWDTAAAVQQMRLTPPAQDAFENLVDGGGVSVVRIVDFPDFEVRRIRIDADSSFELPELEHYGLVMIVEGELAIAGACYRPEQALLLPRRWSGVLAPKKASSGLVFLLALPRL